MLHCIQCDQDLLPHKFSASKCPVVDRNICNDCRKSPQPFTRVESQAILDFEVRKQLPNIEEDNIKTKKMSEEQQVEKVKAEKGTTGPEAIEKDMIQEANLDSAKVPKPKLCAQTATSKSIVPDVAKTNKLKKQPAYSKDANVGDKDGIKALQKSDYNMESEIENFFVVEKEDKMPESEDEWEMI